MEGDWRETIEGDEVQRSDSDMAASLLLGVTWRKSRYSNPCGSCVEVAQLPDGRIAVRNSRYPTGPTLICPRAEMSRLIHSTRQGTFNDRPGWDTKGPPAVQ